ncbi:hypothetical protein ONE63_002052 [Megalurothrips usitatus]|uniref:Aminopeptidase n=1 Tax=Megalurothrips usitatus TaxID=439358 RepID=A0AAV7XEA6_9NEOP|nr:hypothetical protein ONE63_002052 [Megalurothrips usitatus]
MPHAALPHQFERLPTSVIPSHYVLSFKLDLVKCEFEGQMTVDLEVTEATQHIILNSVDLKVRHIELHLDDGTLFLPSKVIFAVKCETVAIFFASEVPPGRCKLSISFKGVLNDSLRGFYRSKYISNDTKEERFCAVTQFEARFAHRCFPCWDEPAIKATFDISLCVPKGRVALSNMPTMREEDLPDGSRLVQFETTPVMSTYLVAMVVGEFDYLEKMTVDDVPVRVYTPLGKQEQGRFALDVAMKALPYFKECFQISYPLPKLDLVAIGNFSAGAMENWGLITYREPCLLVDPENTSTQRKQGIALYVAHELAHQWFGNLVTMEWWTHLWLNEGYATFVEFLCIACLFPEYDIWTQFITETHSPALRFDALKNSHPIEVPVSHHLEAQEIFDDISYHKGASIIRMLHRYIGDQDFSRGMNIYLSSFQFGNATTDDLWTALEEASKKPISEVMSTWTRLVGYPLITVRCEISGNARKLFLKQSQFCADGTSADSDDSKLWMIPVEFSSAGSPLQVACVHLVCAKEATVIIDDIRQTDWIKLNPGSFGFYRVHYSPEMLEMFKPAISDLSLPPIDRLGLLDDLFALVEAGHCSSDQVLVLLDAMRNESDYTVWNCIASVLVKIQKLLQYSHDVQPLFMGFGRHLLSQVSQSILWDPVPNESHKDKLLRQVIIDLLIIFEDESAFDESRKRFNAHVNGTSPLCPDIRGFVYRAVLRKADAATYEIFLKMFREEMLHEEKERIAHGFAAIEDADLLKQALDFAVSDEVSSLTTLSLLVAMAQSKKGRDLVWTYSKENWTALHEKYGPSVILSHFITASFQDFTTEQMADQLQDFLATNEAGGVERAVQQTIEKVRINKAWLSRDLHRIKTFLENFQ